MARYTSYKLKKDEFEVTHIVEKETVGGEIVEIIQGKNKISKEQLEKTIFAYKNETKTMMELRETELAELEKMLEAVNVSNKKVK
jgi:hypothetical protein